MKPIVELCNVDMQNVFSVVVATQNALISNGKPHQSIQFLKQVMNAKNGNQVVDIAKMYVTFANKPTNVDIDSIFNYDASSFEDEYDDDDDDDDDDW